MISERQHRPPTILVVDDYTDALDLLELYLRGAGFVVLTATDGVAAILVATERCPDLIVLDIELPGQSGIEVANILRAEAATRDIPLIAATGNSQQARLDLARKAGFDAIVVKPCDPALLLREIRRLLPPSVERPSTGDRNADTTTR